MYEPIDIEQLAEDILQEHIRVLELDIRWHADQLEWFDSETGRHIVTSDDERASADAAESLVREIEEELRRLRGE